MEHLREKFLALGWLLAQSETLFELCSASDEILGLLAEKDVRKGDGAVESSLRLVVMPFLRRRAILESIILGCAKAKEDCYRQIEVLTGKSVTISENFQTLALGLGGWSLESGAWQTSSNINSAPSRCPIQTLEAEMIHNLQSQLLDFQMEPRSTRSWWILTSMPKLIH